MKKKNTENLWKHNKSKDDAILGRAILKFEQSEFWRYNVVWRIKNFAKFY